MDAGCGVRMSRDECECQVREECVGAERVVSVGTMLDLVMFLSAKNGGVGEILAVDGRLVVRDGDGRTYFGFVSCVVFCVYVSEGEKKLFVGAVCFLIEKTLVRVEKRRSSQEKAATFCIIT